MFCSGTPVYSELFKDYISDCQIFWNVTSINYTYYFRNKKGIELGFSPEINDWKWYVKDGRFKTGWRPLDKSGNFTFRKGIKYQFMAFVFKEPEQTIKWTITAADVAKDPILFGINISLIQSCHIETIGKSNSIYEDVTKYLNETFCSDFPTNKSCSMITSKTYVSSQLKGYYDELINISVCNAIGFQIGDKKIVSDEWKICRSGSKIIAKAQHQSNQKICQCLSGDRCKEWDLTDLRNVKEFGYSPTKAIKRLEVEQT